MANSKVTKLEAAKRLHRTAIRLWFEDEDAVAIHLLAYSSHEILHRLYRSAGHSNLLYDSKSIKEEYRDEFCLSLKAAANFFKHAKQGREDKPGITIDFDPNLNELFLFQSVLALKTLGEVSTFEDFALWSYLFINNHDAIPEAAFKDFAPIERLAFATLKGLPKKEFFQAWKEGVNRMGDEHPLNVK